MLILLLTLWTSVAKATELPPVDLANVVTQDELPQWSARVAEFWLFDRYLGPAPIRTHVCENLDRARDRSDRNYASLKLAGLRVANGTKPGDPYLETLLGPAQVLLRHPATRRLLETVASAQKANASPDLVRRLYLGGLATAAALELMADRSSMEASCDRSYLLLMLLRTLRERPALIRSQRAMDLCRDLEDGFVSDEFPTDQEREALADFISRTQVSPKAIGYDREFRSRMTLSWKGASPDLRVQWMLDVLHGTPSP
jgi:hypothetical protein